MAGQAAHALVELRHTDAVPALVELLAQPDPCAPFEKTVAGKQVTMVRELVRLNHHRNCLLCHAPATNERDPKAKEDRFRRDVELVLGLVPAPGEPLPPSFSEEYYGERRMFASGTVVRADVTYLRQDFSVMQPVKEHKQFNWPQMQRFDFLVRTRPATPDEIKSWQKRQKDGVLSEHHEAALFALRRLSTEDLGPNPAAWRAAFNQQASPMVSWRAPCLR